MSWSFRTVYWSVVTETRSGVTFAGLTYYRGEALASPAFWNAFRDSFVFTVASVVLHRVTAMPVALVPVKNSIYLSRLNLPRRVHH